MMNLDLALRIAREAEHPRDPETAGNLRAARDQARAAACRLAEEVKRLRPCFEACDAIARSRPSALAEKWGMDTYPQMLRWRLCCEAMKRATAPIGSGQ
jgi:hypothetical protein